MTANTALTNDDDVLTKSNDGNNPKPTVRNYESDLDYDSDDDDTTYKTLTLLTEITWDTNENTNNEDNIETINLEWDWEPKATSTQQVNAIINGENNTGKGTTHIPKSFKQACDSEFHERWESAINKELVAMAEHAVWEIADKKLGDRPLPCAWKFSVKEDGTPKVRLYLVGNREPMDSLQNTYAPIADLMIVLWLCSTAVKYKTVIYQMDVTTAFLNAPLNEPKLMRISDGPNWRVNSTGRFTGYEFCPD